MLNPNKKLKIPKKEHSQSQDKSLQFRCDICDFSTSAQNSLSLHKRRLHKLDKNNEAVTQLDNPDFHNRDPKKYQHQCPRYTRRYKKIHHLERHQEKCDGIPPPTFKPMWEKNEIEKYRQNLVKLNKLKNLINKLVKQSLHYKARN